MRAAGSVAEPACALGQQLADRHAVEVGQLGQPLHGHGAVAALVGAHDDGLPAALRLLLHAVQGQPLLGADGAQSRAEGLGVVGHGRAPVVGRARGRGRVVAPGRRSHHWLDRGTVRTGVRTG